MGSIARDKIALVEVLKKEKVCQRTLDTENVALRRINRFLQK